LEGKITAEQWSKDAMKFSLLLYEAGIELGRIAMSKEVKLADARVKFARTLIGLDMEIAKKAVF
jgi:hypothetical protein